MPRGRRPALAWVLFAAVVLIAAWGAYNGDINGNPDPFHEGERLAHYDALVRGALPFRDFFVPHGLGEDVWKGYAACRVLGPSLASLRRVGSNAFNYWGVLPWLGFASVIAAAFALVRGPWITMAVAAVLALGLVEATDRQLLGFVAVALMGGYLARGRPLWLVGAGMAGSLAALYSFEVGLYALASLAATLVAEGALARERPRDQARRRLAALGGGVVVVMAPFLAWCAWKGILADLGHNLWVQTALRGQVWPSSYPSLTGPAPEAVPGPGPFPLERAVLYYLLPAMLVGVLLATAWWYRRTAPSDRQRLILASTLACCFWATVVGRPDRWHVAFAVPAALLLGAVALDARLPWPSWVRRTLGVAGAVALTGVMLAGDGGVLARKVRVTMRGPERGLVASSLPRLAGIRMEPPLRDVIDPLVEQIRRLTGPGDPVLNMTPYGLLLFLAERESAVRYTNSAHIGGSPTLRGEVLDALRRRGAPPRCLLREAGEPLGDDPLARWIDATYRHVATFGPVEVMAPAGLQDAGRPVVSSGA